MHFFCTRLTRLNLFKVCSPGPFWISLHLENNLADSYPDSPGFARLLKEGLRSRCHNIAQFEMSCNVMQLWNVKKSCVDLCMSWSSSMLEHAGNWWKLLDLHRLHIAMVCSSTGWAAVRGPVMIARYRLCPYCNWRFAGQLQHVATDSLSQAPQMTSFEQCDKMPQCHKMPRDATRCENDLSSRCRCKNKQLAQARTPPRCDEAAREWADNFIFNCLIWR